jgi:hypothetical protein
MTSLLSCLSAASWLHSREEDTATYRCYRPVGWALPRTRLPRHRLEFSPGGPVVSWVGGSADARIAREGRWRVNSPQPLRLQIDWQGTPEPAMVEVLACSPELLHVQVVSGFLD